MRDLSNQKHRNPENLSLRLHYGESLKQYRNTLRKKKEQHVRNQLNVIEESIDSNHFWENWKTLNKQHKELSIQNGDVWINQREREKARERKRERKRERDRKKRGRKQERLRLIRLSY